MLQRQSSRGWTSTAGQLCIGVGLELNFGLALNLLSPILSGVFLSSKINILLHYLLMLCCNTVSNYRKTPDVYLIAGKLAGILSLHRRDESWGRVRSILEICKVPLQQPMSVLPTRAQSSHSPFVWGLQVNCATPQGVSHPC
ncbi:hypothetical protein BU24DRAFT_151568 [Aaosphaeria arxii CBS 175.79]|uniref:Uncharacterized protein n=1 Tax=Aaosphaeria arxii CBS 175.79 TaxID=1450172 RepID=A0A6A5XWY7_9PLEO|nr:uncharacterized protein BU24DRAFT_151568 [Aaosphaeria arxii CBS 175.79]KAF2017469.1 hypothetical protein BU24DRAFT_151568 [Aaosphaeria arxii CBS 175.79]